MEKLTTNDMLSLIKAEHKRKGIAGHHIQSMNTFTAIGIKQIVTKQFPIDERFENQRDSSEEDKKIREIGFTVVFTDVRLRKPMIAKKNGEPQLLTPALARKKGLTLSNQMYLDIEITATATMADGSTKIRKDKITELRAGSLPTMVGTEVDTLDGCSRDLKWQLEEDPNDPGGYFIIKGGEWSVSILENTANNSPRAYKNSYKNEETRLEFLSKPGDAFENSTYVVFKLLTDGNILIEMTVGKDNKFEIPFYMIFRLLGMNRDREIVDHCVFGVENTDPITRDLMAVLTVAFDSTNAEMAEIKDVISDSEIAEFLANKLFVVGDDENLRKWAIQRVYALFDNSLFPHIGTGAATRITKLRFCGHLINRLLCVHLGIIEPTDRDRYGNKRLAAAGTSLAKTFKQDFNFAIVKEIKKHLKKEFKEIPFSDVRLAETVKASIKSDDLERMLIQSITSGNKTIVIRKTEITNRVSSQTLYRKNDLNVVAVSNAIDTPSAKTNKQNERADEMRRVHSSYLGYVDVTCSAESGDQVGMKKQLACTASVCDASSSSFLVNKLLGDIMRLDDVTPKMISDESLTKVFVCGNWIGCCKNSHELAAKYREYRRTDKIHYLTSIVWSPQLRELEFWTDVGRPVRPLLIVKNNINEYVAGCRSKKKIAFKQWIDFTPEHARLLNAGKIGIEDLRRKGIVEYISAHEAENAFIAMDIEFLRSKSTDVTYQFTHCDIPQAILGVLSLNSPMSNHSNTTRVTYFTCQRKQACGWFALNYPFRMDKGTLLQHYCERPLVSTFVDGLTYPNGQNAIVALMLHGGQNQEDSITANQGSVDCGLYNASYYTFEKSELQKGEVFGVPDPLRTMDVKPGVIKEHVENHAAKVGTMVSENYMLIEKSAKLPKPSKDYLYSDKSVVYKKKYESAMVEDVVFTLDDSGVSTGKVKLRASRPLRVGDKMSSRTGNKGVVCSMLPRASMMYCEDGMAIDLIINPHTIPTRRAINQLIEAMFAQIAATLGVSIDTTTFREMDIKSAYELAVSLGKKYGAYKRVYCGTTGMWIDALCCVGPTYYLRLQKFVVDECQVVRTGPTTPLTRQPLAGKAQDGSLRFGEMETWVFNAQGCMRALHEKYHADSDGIYIDICRGCGERAVVNAEIGLYRCKHCKGNADIVSVPSSWSSRLFFDEIEAMNIKAKFDLEPLMF